MRIQNVRDRLVRAAQSAMKRLHPQAVPHDESTETAHTIADRALIGSESDRASPHTALSERRHRVDGWRRRVLLKKGARLHAAHLARGEHCSLAMLDTQGIVVAWYDPSGDSSSMRTQVVDRHVGQFYMQADLESNIPDLDLLAAAVSGGNTQQGWRRQPKGPVIWATTVIEAIVLSDGRLQGFTHVIRPAEGPRLNGPANMPSESFDSPTLIKRT